MTSSFDLMVAPNGARLTPKDHPALPVTAAQIADTAWSCAQAGASSIHLHVRDSLGQHSLDPDLYRDVLAHIATLTPLPCQISTEAAGIFGYDTQLHCLMKSGAQDASVALREIMAEPARAQSYYIKAKQRGVDVQHILYGPEDLTDLLRAYDDGTVPEGSRRALFVLGRTRSATSGATPADLDPFLQVLGQTPLTWSACAFGPQEQACLLAALQAGGHARIGFENNRFAPDGTPFADNAAAVASFVEVAAISGFSPRRFPS